MKFNKLLEKQIKETLSEELRSNPSVMQLLSLVNSTYGTYDQQYNLLQNTFKINEEDYTELNQKLEESYQNLNKNIIKTLNDVESLILSFSNLDSIDKLIDNIKVQINKVALNEMVGLYLWDEEDNKLKLLYANGFSDEDKQLAENTAMKRHPGHVFLTGETLFIKDQQKENNPVSIDYKPGLNTGSRMFVPVRSGDKIIGAFGVKSSNVNAFNENQLALLKVFTALAGNAYINISKNKLIEKQNQENAKLSILAKSTSNSIIYTDAQGKITWVNKAFEEKTGFKFIDIIGKKPGSFLCGEETEPDKTDIIRKALQNKTECNVVITNYTKSREPFQVEIQITPVFNDNAELVNYVSIQQDVTERENQKKQNELNLLRITRSEENYSKLLNTTSDIIFTTDKVGNIFFSNKAWQQIFRKEITVGKNIIDYLHPDSKPSFIATFSNIESNLLGACSINFSIIGSDGKSIDLQGDIYSSFDNEILTEHNFFLKDITEINTLKQLTIAKEKEIEKYNSTLIDLTSTNFLEYENIGEVARIIGLKANECVHADFIYIGKYDGENISNIFTLTPAQYSHYSDVSLKKNDFPNYFKLLRKKLYFILSDIDKSTIIPELMFQEAQVIKSLLNIPIKINNNLWGVITLGMKNTFNWQNELISFSKSVADIFGSIAASFDIKANNQRLENVLNSLSETIWGVKLPEFKMEYISKSALALYGYPLEDWFDNINLWSDIIHPEDRAAVLKDSEVLFKNNQTDLEYRIITADNKIKWISGVTKIIRNKDGEPILMTGISKDITSIKESQLELLNYKKAIFESAIVSGTDLQGNILFVNDKFCQISKYTQEELIGCNHNILNSGFHSQAFFEDMWTTINQGKIWRGEIKNKAKDGTEYFIDSSIVPFIKNGKPSQFIAINYESTERVLAKEILNKQKEFYESILDNIPVDIAVFDLKHNYKYLNKEAIKDREVRSFMIGKDDFAYAKLKGIDSSMAQARRDRFNEVINSQKIITWLDTQLGSDGKTKHKERRFFVDKANNFVIGYAVDVTDLIEKENLLSASIEEKVTLLGEIHHRVKNNLALVVGLIEMEVFRSTDSLLINQLKEVLRKISAIGLIHEKLYQSNNFSSIDMPHYIKDFVKLSMDINQGHVAPVINYDFDEILLNTQQSIPLALCLNELLINSQKHAFHNNPSPSISISLKREEEMLVFKYADNGKGISADTDISKLKSLGFKLILIFIKQLKGTYVITNESGFEITITFKTTIAAHNKSVALTK